MRGRLPNVLRAATIAVFVLALLMAGLLALDSHGETKATETAEMAAGSLSVDDAISTAHPRTETLAIRGYLFAGGGTGVRLCPRRKPNKPPVCVGPFLDVYGLDVSGLPWRSGKSFGRRIRWLDDPVTVYGTVLGTALTAHGPPSR